jgi:hypothetical protein
MSFTLQNSINFARTVIQYVPLTAGLGGDPAVSVGTFIRNTITSAPFVWDWNRAVDSSITTTANGQDYTLSTTNFGFLEKATLTDSQGNIYEIKDIFNNLPLSLDATALGSGARPTAISVLTRASGTVTFRLLPAADQVYTLTLIYQKASGEMGPFFITAAANASAGNTAYAGAFDPDSFLTGATANITGFVANVVNNGSFTVVSCSTSSLVLANAGGIAETISAYASNYTWSPIPDSFRNIYDMLFLGEAMAVADDARAQIYRQRGMAALLSKAEGLTETQKNIFMQQWLARGVERTGVASMAQMGNQARGV